MIPMFWLFLFGPLAILADWLVARLGRSSGADSPRLIRVAARLTAAAVAGVLTWWLLDVRGFLAQVTALRAGDFAAARAAEPHPMVNLSGVGLLALGAIEFLVIGLYALVWPERSNFLWGDFGSKMEARPHMARVFGVVIIGVAALFAAGAFAALPAK